MMPQSTLELSLQCAACAHLSCLPCNAGTVWLWHLSVLRRCCVYLRHLRVVLRLLWGAGNNLWVVALPRTARLEFYRGPPR